jgi:hypothetical protein
MSKGILKDLAISKAKLESRLYLFLSEVGQLAEYP